MENTAQRMPDSATITVIRNEVLPAVEAGPDLIIDCAQDTVSPVTTGTDPGSSMIYSWSSSTGGILGDSLLTPSFFTAGVYITEVFNTQNLRSDPGYPEVTDIRALPNVGILPAAVLTCADLTVSLDGTTSDQGHHVYQWSGTGPITASTSLTPVIQSPGWYVLLSTDTLNHCQQTDSVLVTRGCSTAPFWNCSTRQSGLQQPFSHSGCVGITARTDQLRLDNSDREYCLGSEWPQPDYQRRRDLHAADHQPG
ncbi:MAG: hypothetical protein IPJ06_14600 [Saprospiraceae bacterium]|nr:hypothetical protein [Saprospiraceae bacterium]